MRYVHSTSAQCLKVPVDSVKCLWEPMYRDVKALFFALFVVACSTLSVCLCLLHVRCVFMYFHANVVCLTLRGASMKLALRLGNSIQVIGQLLFFVTSPSHLTHNRTVESPCSFWPKMGSTSVPEDSLDNNGVHVSPRGLTGQKCAAFPPKDYLAVPTFATNLPTHQILCRIQSLSLVYHSLCIQYESDDDAQRTTEMLWRLSELRAVHYCTVSQ